MPRAKLRVTGGTARGIPLAEPRGVRLRPSTGLVREALFNILGSRTEGARVLDLYAGTGALAIEALSRGAASAVFIEAESACCQAILQSLARSAMAARGTVIRGRLPAALTTADGKFDLVFLDPPYDSEDGESTLMAVPPHCSPGAMIVYEHTSRYNPPERPAGLRRTDDRVYGDSALAFYALEEGE